MELSRRIFLKHSLAGMAAMPSFQPTKLQRSGSIRKSDLPYLSIAETSALLRQRQLSPVELTEAILGRIDQLEPKLHAFITISRDEAIEAARLAETEITSGKYRGPLHGIPVGVKDTHYTKGIKTTAGTPLLADFIPSFDATVVARLKDAGAILIGKTNLPAFSFGGDTPSHNPWDLSKPTGGSSGGSAAALAAGMLQGATGGDTSGSVRFPATLCGVVGMKPTYGMVSRYGVIPISYSLDHVGPMTRTVEDNALMLNVLAGYDPQDPSSSDVAIPDFTRGLGKEVRGMTIGIPQSSLFEGYHPDVMKVFQAALQVFERLGAKVTAVELPSTMNIMSAAHRIIRISEAASYHEPFLASQANQYGKDRLESSYSPRRDVEAGSLITVVQYLRAQKIREAFRKQMNELFEPLDVFITPGRPEPAGVPIGAPQWFNLSVLFNLTGFPALALPAGFSTSPLDMPVGLQVSAKPFQEETIYTLAYAYESETRWHERRPPI